MYEVKAIITQPYWTELRGHITWWAMEHKGGRVSNDLAQQCEKKYNLRKPLTDNIYLICLYINTNYEL